MGLEAVAYRQLVADLFLEQHRFLAQQPAHRPGQGGGQLVEAGVTALDVLDAADDLPVRIEEVFLPVHPVLARLLWPFA